MRNYKRRRNSEFSLKEQIIYISVLTVLLFILTAIQTSGITPFGAVPAIGLATVCAIGFIFGEEFGAICGIFGGFFADALGGSGFSLAIILYMLAGYLCGVCRDKLLSKNLPSFLVFAVLSGLLRALFTLIFLFTASVKLTFGKIMLDFILPELGAYLIFVIPMYFVIKGIRGIMIFLGRKA